MRVPRNSAGAVVGQIDKGWLVKRLNPALHMLRTPRGWATDVAHLEGIKGIRIITPGGVWEAEIGLWRRHGIEFNRGHGRQIVLPEKYWVVHTKEQGRLL